MEALKASASNLQHDLTVLPRFLKLLKIQKTGHRTDDYTLADFWGEKVAEVGKNTHIIYEDQQLTYKDSDELSTRMGRFILGQGLEKETALALMLENQLEYVPWWLGAAKVGVSVAMINFSTKSKGLVHCIKSASSRAVLFDRDTAANVQDVEGDLDGVQFWYWGGALAPPPPAVAIKDCVSVTHSSLEALPLDASPFKERRAGLKVNSTFGYIFTSGTTGLPKAAIVTHIKCLGMSGMYLACGLTPQDRMYTCLPLFHSAGGGLGAFGTMQVGCTMVLAKKFSANRFWNDIVKHGCTGFQYIGELGRYLVNHAREHPETWKIPHKLQLAVGNGLRPEVWDEFQDGFRIPMVVEFYAATEGNGGLVNFCHREKTASRGAVGRMGWLLNKIVKAKLVKFDIEKEEPIRGPDGFCIECDLLEQGELIFPNVKDNPLKSFKGYTDAKSTAKKLISDTFTKGDSWFRTGDLLSKDAFGHFFFGDRIGDTFRWKGENCSTMEISEVISSFEGVAEANVYGVKVPNSMDGRACMAALQADTSLRSREKLDALQKLCQKELPKYAQPLFLRFLPKMEITGTFKHQKVQLREHGCDPNLVEDEMWWLSPETRRYEPFGAAEWQLLTNGRSKL